MSKQQRTLRQQKGVLAAIRREKFDVAFNFSAADRALIMMGLTGAASKVSYSGGRPHFWKKWLVSNWMAPRTPTNPVFERRRQMLASCGLLLGETKFGLDPSETGRNWARQNVQPGALHFSINASTHLKEWPIEYWGQLAHLLWKARPDARIIATARSNPREQARLTAFSSSLREGNLQTFTDLGLGQLTAFI